MHVDTHRCAGLSLTCLSVSLFVRDRWQGPRGGGRTPAVSHIFFFELQTLTCLLSSFFPVPPDFLPCFSGTESVWVACENLGAPCRKEQCGWRRIWSSDRCGAPLSCRSLMKTLWGSPLVALLAREGLWYAAGSGGNRQEMFVIRRFSSASPPHFQRAAG